MLLDRQCWAVWTGLKRKLGRCVRRELNPKTNRLLYLHSRWLTVHVPLVRFIQSICGIVEIGGEPPAMLHLSDGGHFENLGFLPLFKRRLKKILVVDGGYIKSGSQYGNDLLAAMELAREILHCSFTYADKTGRDVLAKIREKFALTKKDRNHRQPPRWFKFQVHYHDIDEKGNRINAGEGEVIIISPRHPGKNKEAKTVTWKKCEVTIDPDLERGGVKNTDPGKAKEMWGEGPGLSSQDADNLEGCCCECCHGCCHYCCYVCSCCYYCSCCKPSKFCFGVFPHHKTANQLFTPKMFSAYHREGYRACDDVLEAEGGNEFFKT